MNIYDQVSWNKTKSYIIIFIFIIFISSLGIFLGWLYGSYILGFIVFTIAAVIYSIIAWIEGSNIILKATGAREVTKAEYPHLFHAIEGLSIAAAIPIPKAYVIDDESLNAFATGKDPKNASITVTTGLLKKLNRQELEGVVAHEMSHIKNYDIRIMLFSVVMIGMTILLSHIILRSFLFSDRDRENNNFTIIIIVVGIILAVLAPFIAELMKLAISRKREYLADANGALLTRNPEGLASALEKISEKSELKKADKATAHLFIASPLKAKSFFSNLFSTHPPIDDRIKKLRSM